MTIEHHVRAIGLIEAARLVSERAMDDGGSSVSPENLCRIASLLTAFATVYICDDRGNLLRPLGGAELSGASVAADGALVFSDGRVPLANPVILEESIGELGARLARLGVLRRPAG
jgi:hypothetical protein